MICDASTVVGLTNQVPDGLPRCGIVIVDVNDQHIFANIEVRVIEIVRDVPAQVLELLPLKQGGVEIAELKHHLLVFGRLD